MLPELRVAVPNVPRAEVDLLASHCCQLSADLTGIAEGLIVMVPAHIPRYNKTYEFNLNHFFEF